MPRFFPISQPSIGEREVSFVTDAVTSGWVSSIGQYIERFEKAFATFCEAKYALAVSNGTTALHLALASAGVEKGDEVIIPDLTFIATANAVAYTGARVVPVDIDRDTLCIDPRAIRAALTPRTRAIIPVHLYGQPAAMDSIKAIADENGLLVVEDAAEAHGAEYQGRKVGALGDLGMFSFYGNKIITSGEGGMLTTNREDLYSTARLLRDHAMSAERRYWHTRIGFNYRMTNLQAALGLAQFERIDSFIEKRRQIVSWYRAGLADLSRIRLNREVVDSRSVCWMVCVELDTAIADRRDELMRLLKQAGVDSRPYFYPVSDMPMYERAATPVAHEISRRGLNLPSYFDLSQADVNVICETVHVVFRDMAIQ